MKVQPTTIAMAKTTKVIKKALPAVGILGVVAGASMGPGNPIRDAKHIPGTSIDDPLAEQIGYFSDRLVDIGEDVGEAVLNGTQQVLDGALDGFHDLTGVGVDGAHDFVDGVFVCRSEFESPEVDGEILVKYDSSVFADVDPYSMIGEFIKVRVIGADEYDLIAEPVEI